MVGEFEGESGEPLDCNKPPPRSWLSLPVFQLREGCVLVPSRAAFCQVIPPKFRHCRRQQPFSI
jgi:hypothetical protein